MATATLHFSEERLRSMSQAELYELYQMLKDLKRAKERRKTEDYFKNAHSGQHRFHKAQNRIRVFLGGNRCLSKGTLIATTNGIKAIEDIKPGDYVYSENIKPIEVYKLFNNGEKEVADLCVFDKTAVSCTADHVFLTKSGRQTTADRIEESLRLASGASIKATWGENKRIVPTYDIHVKSETNLYCLANGFIVHNSGKSTAGANELYLRVSGKHPHKLCRTPIKALIVAQDFTTHVKDIIEPKIKEWFPPGFIKNVDTNHAKAWSKVYCKNGSTIDIKTHDQDLKVFEGSDYDFVWFDEPPPESIFKAIWRGLVDREGECIITGTPIVEPWIYDLIAEADREMLAGDVWYQYVNTYENALNIGEGDKEKGVARIQAFERLLDEDEREARIKGKFLHLKGLIFKPWDRKTHLIEPFPWPNHWPVIFSVDPHPRKPWAVSFIGLTEHKNKILLASELIPGVIDDVARRSIEIRDELETTNRLSKPKIIRSWIDNYASVELMEKTDRNGDRIKVIDEFNKSISPFMPNCKPAPKDVATKIQIMKQWLTPKPTNYGERPEFFVFDTEQNKRFVYEIEHYRWASYTGKQKQKLKDQPIKEDDDILDTVMQVALAEGHGKQKSALGEKPAPIRYARGRR